jgi:hypothetical protein
MYVKRLMAQVSPFAMMVREGEGMPAGGGAATQTQTPSNAGGTPGATQNNAGDNDFDVSGFWNDPEPEPAAANSAPAATTQGQTATSHVDYIKAQVQRDLGGIQVDAAAMMQDFQNGKIDSLQTYINSVTQQAVTTAVEMSAKMLQGAQERMKSQMQAQIGGTLSRRDAETQLGQEFPWAVEPGFKEVTTAMFNKALKRHNGNAQKALHESAAYLRTMKKKISGNNPGTQNNGGFAGATDPAGADVDWAALLNES